MNFHQMLDDIFRICFADKHAENFLTIRNEGYEKNMEFVDLVKSLPTSIE